MPPPSKPLKRGSAESNTTSPAGSVAPEHPHEQEKQPKRRKTAKELGPTTALQRGREACNKLLAKKTQASNVALTLKSVVYADALCAEMQNFAQQFERFGCTCAKKTFPGVQPFTCPSQAALPQDQQVGDRAKERGFANLSCHAKSFVDGVTPSTFSFLAGGGLCTAGEGHDCLAKEF